MGETRPEVLPDHGRPLWRGKDTVRMSSFPGRWGRGVAQVERVRVEVCQSTMQKTEPMVTMFLVCSRNF